MRGLGPRAFTFKGGESPRLYQDGPASGTERERLPRPLPVTGSTREA